MKKRISLVVGMLAVAFSVSAVQAAETRFAVQDATGTTDKFVVHDNGYIGIGTSAPRGPLDVSTTGGSEANAAFFLTHSATGVTPGASAAPNFTFNRNNTAAAGNLGNLRQGDRIGAFVFGSNVIPDTGPTVFQRRGYIIANAESDWTTLSQSTFLDFYTTNALATKLGMRITGSGNVGIGTATPTSRMHVVGIKVFANNAAAIAGGLTAGAFYRTGADPDVLCIVH